MSDPPAGMKGRGATGNPANRFLRVHCEWDATDLSEEDRTELLQAHAQTEYFQDEAQNVVTENDSPDIPFRYSINPYRGCVHGCAYCYARPYHEYLGLSAGLDFENKIFVKLDVAARLREWLQRRGWSAEPIAVSGVTDCYQPIERHYRLTRQILEVALEYRQPLKLITKNALVTRDRDLLSQLARQELVSVAVSITTLDHELARQLEPRTSTPTARLRAVRELHEAGIPVQVMAAPIIPGLTDDQLPEILKQAAQAGAGSAGYTMLRLPGAVQQVFADWLAAHRPDRAKRVLNQIRQVRGGALNDSEFGARMRGEGVTAELLSQTFRVFAHKHGLDRPPRRLRSDLFRVPGRAQQLSLFDQSETS